MLAVLSPLRIYIKISKAHILRFLSPLKRVDVGLQSFLQIYGRGVSLCVLMFEFTDIPASATSLVATAGMV